MAWTFTTQWASGPQSCKSHACRLNRLGDITFAMGSGKKSRLKLRGRKVDARFQEGAKEKSVGGGIRLLGGGVVTHGTWGKEGREHRSDAVNRKGRALPRR